MPQAHDYMSVVEVASAHVYMNVTEVEKFQSEMMELCEKVLNDGQATNSQRRRFKSFVKDIVFDTLNLNRLPHD